jgi:serine/threonine protein kinase
LKYVENANMASIAQSASGRQGVGTDCERDEFVKFPPGESKPPKIKGKSDLRSSHPRNVIDNTVEWLRLSRDIDSNLQRYYRDLCSMWTSGEFEWTKNHAIPSQTQVYYWIKNSRRERPVPHDKQAARKRQCGVQAQQATRMKKLAAVFRARQNDYRGTNHGQLALTKAFETVVLLLQLDLNYKSVLLLAQISRVFNYRIVQMQAYAEVKMTVQGKKIIIDSQHVIQRLECISCKPSSDLVVENSSIVTVKQPSLIQVHVDFSHLSLSGQVDAINKFSGDYKDTIVNMGDVLNTERLVFIGEAGFSSIFVLQDRRVAIKVFKIPVDLEQAVRNVANEAACFHLATTLRRNMASRGPALRNKLLPFVPLPAVEACGSTSGAMALPSWGLGKGLYYPALLMEMAISTVYQESRALSKLFFSNPMGVVPDEGFVRLASFVKLVAEPLACMHRLHLAHGDVKEENILAMKVAPGVDGYIHFTVDGKKWTGRLGDCSKSLCFGIEYHTESEPVPTEAASSTTSARRQHSEVAQNEHQACQPLQPDEEINPPAGMTGKRGTVPLGIPMRAIHRYNPVAPSTPREGESATIRHKAPQYSGTLAYTPPEAMPTLQDGAEFLTSRDYQPGDMWALGIVLANVLGGSNSLNLSMLGSHDKRAFAQAGESVIWQRLNKLPAALQHDCVPPQWTEVMDLLQSLTRVEPAERMTADEVLQHPFLRKADKLHQLYS